MSSSIAALAHFCPSSPESLRISRVNVSLSRSVICSASFENASAHFFASNRSCASFDHILACRLSTFSRISVISNLCDSTPSS